MNNCEDCPAHHPGNFIRHGINMSRHDYLVALSGNPNTGKSTIFNNLTGLRQHTGNWPGKTVTRAEGAFSYSDKKFKVVDLPGTYSLFSMSTDEEIARDFLLFGKPDVTVVVVDATRVERNLNLVLQILEITDRVVICLNLIDEAQRHNLSIDDRQLSRDLGVPVVPTAARVKRGMDTLLHQIYDVASGAYPTRPFRIRKIPSRVSRAVEKLTKQIKEQFPHLPNARWIAMRLLEGDQRIIDAIRSEELGLLHQDVTVEKKLQSYNYEKI
jgi:ferrous iron transport protein B